MTTAIALREVTKVNWKQCLSLQLAEEQKGLVASNAFSLAQSKFDPTCIPMAIYHEETMVGFIMYGRNDEGEYWILRLMIDYRYQGQGFGKAALQQVIEILKSKPDCHEIFLDYVTGNSIAEKLYRSLGFRPTGEVVDREVIMSLPVER